ncbi:MAG TPA: FAD binding domain-containing protein [Burkholderiales bacterium]|nr:FAD binding domain-containing protein [Burkholderiales bacterium]
MKAPAFAYAKPATLGEAFALLQVLNAKVLAGGQSLIPSLNMRLSSPGLLVDITGLKELKGISVQGNSIRIGALVTHAQMERSPEIQKHLPLLAQAIPHVAHAAIRNRGTIGGSMALADPAAEYPAVAVALEAEILIEGKKGKRKAKATAFFKGLFETDLKPGELLVAVEFPIAKPSDKSVFLELARRHGDYAIIGLAAHNSKFVFFSAGSKPVVVEGGSMQKAKENLSKTLKPTADLYSSSAAKLHLAGVLLERAWTSLST